MNTSDDTEVTNFDTLDIALAHWHIKTWGGAEYLMTKMAEALDINTIHTIGTPDPSGPNPYGDISFTDVTPSLDYSRVRQFQQRFGRLFEYAQWEDVDWREFGDPDVLVSSGATTRAVISPDDTAHVNYCHSPPRWFYDLYHDRKSSLTGVLSRPLIRYLRLRDATLDSRVDYYFANSPIIKRRLWKYYKRESEVLYPPVDVDIYQNNGDNGYFLHLGRLDEEKGVPAIVEAFCGFNEQLVMAGGMGDIDDQVRQQIDHARNIDYCGFVSEEEKRNLLANCTALVFNGRNEDFGIVPIEANASGKPVLAPDEGFPGLFVQEGQNGHLHDGRADDIRNLIDQTNITGIQRDLSQFSLSSFDEQMRDSIRSAFETVHIQNI